MSDIIEMLERVGSDARIRFAAPKDLEATLVDGGDPSTARRVAGLEALLAREETASRKVYCAIQMPAEEEEQEDEGDAEQPSPESPVEMVAAELG